MNIVYFFFLNFVKSACECEAEAWTEWELMGDCGNTHERRTRICSSISGWKLGLGCNDADNNEQEEKNPITFKPCREFYKISII